SPAAGLPPKAAKPDRTLEAEWIGFAALGGSPAAGEPVGVLGGIAPVAGISLPFGRLDLVGITLSVFGPGGAQGPASVVAIGNQVGRGSPNSGVNQPVNNAGATLIPGLVVPSGFLVTPHATPVAIANGLTAADVTRLITQGI